MVNGRKLNLVFEYDSWGLYLHSNSFEFFYFAAYTHYPINDLYQYRDVNKSVKYGEQQKSRTTS